MKWLPFAAALVLFPVGAPAQERIVAPLAPSPEAGGRWEYFVISQEDAMASLAETGQEEAYKAWLAANRPETYKKITELEAQSAAADSLRKKFKSFISHVSSSHFATLAELDYYLNVKGKDYWELVSRQDGVLIFKRRPP